MRLITRYGSRKLYDTREREYVSLGDLARHVRDGEQLCVTDHHSGQDVTARTLALVLYEQARQGALVTAEVLHDVIRTGIGPLQHRADELAIAAVERMTSLARAKEECVRLREGMKAIERSLQELGIDGSRTRSRRSAPRKESRGRPTRKAGSRP